MLRCTTGTQRVIVQRSTEARGQHGAAQQNPAGTWGHRAIGPDQSAPGRTAPSGCPGTRWVTWERLQGVFGARCDKWIPRGQDIPIRLFGKAHFSENPQNATPGIECTCHTPSPGAPAGFYGIGSSCSHSNKPRKASRTLWVPFSRFKLLTPYPLGDRSACAFSGTKVLRIRNPAGMTILSIDFVKMC